MGLYGGVKKNSATATAYPGVPYDREIVLFLSEIDPALHAAVASEQLRAVRRSGREHDKHHQLRPEYFLITRAYSVGMPALPAGSARRHGAAPVPERRAGIPRGRCLLAGRLRLVAEAGSPTPIA